MNKKGMILVIVGGILIMVAGLMVTYNNYQNKKAEIETKKIYEQVKEKKVIEEIDQISNEEMQVINIDGNDYIGTISIPVLNLLLPVMADWDYDRMKTSPCRYYGSIYTDDLVICAHSYDSLFGRIKKLNLGDLLILTDANKEDYIYKVEVIEILAPTDVTEMIESEFDLTLYTCTVDGLNRITVRLNRV